MSERVDRELTLDGKRRGVGEREREGASRPFVGEGPNASFSAAN